MMKEASQADLQAQWQQDRAELLMQMPFLGTLAMQLDLIIGSWRGIPRAATDGDRIFGNSRFLRRLTQAERIFVLAHEVWHCAALHIPRRGCREPERWNVAVDHETNAILKDAGLKVPEGAILLRDYRYRRASAETIYERLPRRPPKRGRFADTHEPQGQDWPGATDMSSGARAPWERWPQRVRSALQMSGQRPGDLPQGMARVITPLLTPTTTPWPRLLRRYVGRHLGASQSWLRPNRRHLGRGQWLPGRSRDAVSLAVAIDASGSTRAVLPLFARELRGILQAMDAPLRLRLLTFDATVHTDETINAAHLSGDGITVYGGGGTDFRPVFNRLRTEPPDIVVMLTDGHGPRGEQPPPYPVIWAVPEPGSDILSVFDGWHGLKPSGPAFSLRSARRRQSKVGSRKSEPVR